MISDGGELEKDVSRKEEIKNDPSYQSIALADIDAFVDFKNEIFLDKNKTINSQFKENLNNYLDSITFPVQRNILIEELKNITNEISIITFLENIPDKMYHNKKEILQIVEK